MAIDLKKLRLFLALAEEMHFSSAARRMNIAQPALSRTIRKLEEELATDLFKRSTRKVELTEAGKLFRQEVELAVERIDRAIILAQNAAAGRAGTLRIGYMDFALEGAFPQILRDFRSRFPAVKIEARASFTERIIEELESGKIDIGFVVGPIAHKALATFSLQSDRFVAVVPRSHSLAKRPFLRLKELAGEPLVLGRRSSWLPYVKRIESLCGRAGFTPNIVQEADTTESIFAFVASGIGSTIYLERAFNYHPPDIVIIPLTDVEESVSTDLAWRIDDRNATVNAFISHCRNAARMLSGKAVKQPVRE